jgi:transcriptional regulator with GAF, ATPase, and Fis domain
MHSDILIVEDQFIEANDLRIILEKAGHTICGIAKSVDQALVILQSVKPDIVLLDIFLKGDLTGIDLAKTLTKQNVPFIYLSANSNESTFEAAKATQPYGFLVKPYREKDILAALDIASYRHKHMLELQRRQEQWISSVLLNITTEIASTEQKLLLLAKAFRSVIHFEFMIIDTHSGSDGPGTVYAFQRTGLDEYITSHGWDFVKKINITLPELNHFRKIPLKHEEAIILNGREFSDDLQDNILQERLNQLYGINAALMVPISLKGNNAMSISFFSAGAVYFTSDHTDLLSQLTALLSTVLENISSQKIKTSPLQMQESKVESEISQQQVLNGIIGKSAALLRVIDQVSQVAAFDTTILVLGETGVGKEGIARAIHQLSHRKNKPFVKINCAAIPATLVESELFGHEKGAFTGAAEKRIGKFEQAEGGTIFLDEIGEIPMEVQSKLLRVLQEKELEHIGGRTTIKIDVRIIAATNRNLYKEVAASKFRIDLYYRINVFPVTLPPLRDRKDDIPLLVEFFLEKNAPLSQNIPKQISAEALKTLVNYSWPGNIRELQHLIERHVLITPAPVITRIELPAHEDNTEETAVEENHFRTIADVDKSHIIAVLKKCNGKVSGKGGAAEILQIPATTLTSKMKKLGITWKYLYEQ